MYKLTFDDKPEANTYIKWASQKGYKVEGPFREKLAKNAKKFDLNGKPKKYHYVVIRKRGGGPGMGGAMPDDDTKPGVNKVRIDSEGRSVYVDNDVYFALAKKYKVHEIARMSSKERRAKAGISSGSISKASSTKHESGAGGGSSKGAMSMGEALRKASKQSGGKEHKESQTLLWWGKASSEEKKNLAQDAGYKGALGLKLAVELSPEQVERLTEIRGKKVVADKAEGKPVTVEPVYTEPPVSKAAKKSDKRAKKEGAVAVGEKPLERPSTAKESAIGKLIDAQAKAAAEAQERQQTFIGTQKAREMAKGAIERDIARQKARKLTDAEQVAKEWEAQGKISRSQAEIMADLIEKEKTAKEQAAKEAEFWAREEKLGSEEVIGERVGAKAKRLEEEVKGEKYVRKAYWKPIEETEKAKEKAKGKEFWEAMKTSAVRDRAQVAKGAKARKEDKKAAARQETARKQVIKQYLKEGRQLPAGVSDYVAEKEKLQFEKAAAIGGKKVKKVRETAERERKYEKTFPSYEEAAKWGKGQREVSKEEDVEEMRGRAQRMAGVMGDKAMTPEQKRAEIGRLGKEFEEVAKAKRARGGVGAKRKSYVVRTKKGFKVITGTKEELETPTSLKAALAKEKRKFKKRKKLLEKPLREIKRAKKVLRTTSKHGAKMLLRKPSSLVPTRGKHPAIGNVSMEYHRARIATPILVPKSIAGQYTTGEDTKRRR